MKKELGIFILLVVLCVTVAIINPRFLGAANLTNMARLIGMFGIFSIGLGLVIITSGIDLSVGSVFALQGVLIAIGVVTYVLLHRSVFGRYLYAVGRNEDAARYSGINSQLIIIGAYTIEMLLVGIAGVLFAFYTNSISPANYGLSYELYGIAA